MDSPPKHDDLNSSKVSKNYKNFAKMNQLMNMSLSSGKLVGIDKMVGAEPSVPSRKKSTGKDPNPPCLPRKASRNGSDNVPIKFVEKQGFKIDNLRLSNHGTP